jgi:hypothetical protein
MTPIVVTNSSPAGRVSRVKAAPSGGGGGGTLLANFQASVDFGTPSLIAGTNFSAVTKNGVTLFRDGTGQIYPCDHPILKAPTYTGGQWVFRINNNAGPGANEIDFSLATSVTELFVEWYVYMATGSETPSYGGRIASGTANGTANDKVFRLYDGPGGFGPAYSFPNTTVKIGMSMKGTAANTVENAYIETQKTINVVYPPNTDPALGPVDVANIGEVSPVVRHAYGGASAYIGRWVRHQLRAKAATAANNDGIVQFWLDNDLVLSRTDLSIYAVTSGLGVMNSFRYGYLFGYRNSGVQDSRIYMDNFSFSTGGFV